MSNHWKRKQIGAKIHFGFKLIIVAFLIIIGLLLFLGTKTHGLHPGAWGGSFVGGSNISFAGGLVDESNMTGTIKIFNNCKFGSILYEDQYYSLVTFLVDMPKYGDIVQGSFVYNNLQELKDITENRQIKVFVKGASSSFEENLNWIKENCVK